MKGNVLECLCILIFSIMLSVYFSYGVGIERGKQESRIDISEQSNMFRLTDEEQTTAETLNKDNCRPWEALSTEAFVMLIRSSDLLEECSIALSGCTNRLKEK